MQNADVVDGIDALMRSVVTQLGPGDLVLELADLPTGSARNMLDMAIKRAKFFGVTIRGRRCRVTSSKCWLQGLAPLRSTAAFRWQPSLAIRSNLTSRPGSDA
jgi:hypothetical protein